MYVYAGSRLTSIIFIKISYSQIISLYQFLLTLSDRSDYPAQTLALISYHEASHFPTFPPIMIHQTASLF